MTLALDMTDRPIIFSAPMILALLDGRKTMTRRLSMRESVWADEPRMVPTIWQRVKPGDRLWVRETWKPYSTYAGVPPRDIPQSQVFYSADDRYAPSNTPWVSPIHMPRWASRLTLVVTATKIERLQEISEDDAGREGMGDPYLNDGKPPFEDRTIMVSRVMQFRNLWKALHGPGSWDANPAVVAFSFSVHACNVDAIDRDHRVIAMAA